MKKLTVFNMLTSVFVCVPNKRNICVRVVCTLRGRRGSRDDMAAMAAGGQTSPGAGAGAPLPQDHHVTLMEDPDVWRPN